MGVSSRYLPVAPSGIILTLGYKHLERKLKASYGVEVLLMYIYLQSCSFSALMGKFLLESLELKALCYKGVWKPMEVFFKKVNH